MTRVDRAELRRRAERYVSTAPRFGFEWTCPWFNYDGCTCEDDGYISRADAIDGLLTHVDTHHDGAVGA